ncbi:PucR family transcriptional regulator [Paeniglutamicibacter cryotolerans]|nr:PucR family transcriptional regulator [Paeniglutamicibacter cryotolerans]
MPGLGIEYLAGLSGGRRPVSWAHAVDLPDPWQWVNRGDLLMTTGAGMPSGAAQANWLNRIIDAGVSGLIIAPHPGAPPVHEAMLQLADELQFPLLSASFELEFVSLARIVIKNSLDLEHLRLEKAKRLFDAYGEALARGADRIQRLEAVARALGWRMQLIDDVTGQVLVSSHQGMKGDAGDSDSSIIPVPGRMRTSLCLRTESTSPPDARLAHYAAGITALDLEQHAKSLDQRRTEGEQILCSLLKGAVELSAVTSFMGKLHDSKDLVFLRICVGLGGEYDGDTIHFASAIQNAGMLLAMDDEALLILMYNDIPRISKLAGLLGQGTQVGISLPLSGVNGVPEARRQAMLSLRDAQDSGAEQCTYGEGNEADDFFPRSVSGSRALVEKFLGPITAHDQANNGDLYRSLELFLGCDRSFLQASKALNIHRQTLVYRLNSIEKLTGLHPSSTEGTSKFWLAMQAGHRAGIL